MWGSEILNFSTWILCMCVDFKNGTCRNVCSLRKNYPKRKWLPTCTLLLLYNKDSWTASSVSYVHFLCNLAV